MEGRTASISRDAAIASGQFVREKEYWLNKLSGELIKSYFPYDYNKTKTTDSLVVKKNSVTTSFSGDLFSGLMRLSRGHDYTLHMIAAAVVVVLLDKYTYNGNKDIIIGAPIYKQKIDADREFVNTVLALRVQPEEHMTFKELLFQVRETMLEADENKNYPIEVLMSQLNMSMSEYDCQLFDVAVLLENIHDISYLHPVNLNMIFCFRRTGESMEMEVQYNASRYQRATIERIAAHFTGLLQQGLFNVELRLTDIDITTVEEKKQLLEDFNDTAVEYPRDKTIQELFVEQAARTPGHTAVTGRGQRIAQRAGGWVCHLSYGKLNEKSDQLAHVLREKGVKSDIIVGIMVERSVEMIIGILAILKAGGAYLPIDPNYPQKRIKYMLADSNARVLLSGVSEGTEVINLHTPAASQPSPAGHPKLSRGDFFSLQESPPWRGGPKGRGGSSLAYIIYTSGTTGKPKGVLTTHYNVTRVVRNTNYIDITPNDRVLQLSNYAFDGSVFDIYGALLNGAALVMIDREDVLAVDRLSGVIKREAITVFFTTTALFNTLVDLDIGALHGIRKVLFGGERVSLNHSGKALEYLGKDRIIHVYGPTETTVYATYYFINSIDGSAGTIPIGNLISNTTVYILDRSLKPVPLGVIGEVYIGGYGVARGYLNQPELTAEKFILAHSSWLIADRREKKRDVLPGGVSGHFPMSYELSAMSCFYRTGDLARWLADGNIEFIGRIDRQVKIRGFRIEPGEIESRLLNHNQVKEAVVLVREDSSGDKYLCAYIVAVPVPQQAFNLSELREYLSRDLPAYMVPANIVTLDRMPLTPNGKVDRAALPIPGVGAAAQYAYTAPRNPLEQTLVEIWSAILNLDPESLDIDANFFERGGHSLKATTMMSEIHKELNVKVDLLEIFKSPTIRDLSRHIRDLTEDAYTSIAPVEEREYYPLSSAQKRLYVLQQLILESTAYNMPVVLVLEGELDREKLESTFRRLIERHESLRTSFQMEQKSPVQKIWANDQFEFSMEYYDLAVEGDPAGIIEGFIRPFDLSYAPLFRVGLIHTPLLTEPPSQEGISKDKYILMIDMHHIISDGVSMGIFVREFMALYSGRFLPLLRIQYKDFSQWQNRLFQLEEIKQQESFWLQQFENGVPILEFPFDYTRPAVVTFAGSHMGTSIGADETAALKEMALKENITLFMAFTVVFNILFSKLSGQEDIVIGTPIAGRRDADIETVIGMFVNTLPLRNFPGSEKTVLAFLHEVIERTLQSFDNQDYPFEELVDKLGVARDTSRNPLFDVMFLMQNIEISPVEIQSLTLKPYATELNIAKFDMVVTITDYGEVLYFDINYCTALFKPETIRRFFGYFNNVLASVLESPCQRISDVQIITEAEKQQVLYDFNQTAADYPADKTIHELFEEQVSRTPDGVAVVGSRQLAVGKEKKNEAPIQLTYRELNEESNQLTNVLREKGVAPDTIVAIMVDRSIEMIIGILGILKAGGAYLPIDPNYPQDRIDYMLKDSKAKILVSELSELSEVSEGTKVVKFSELSELLPTHLTHPTHLTQLNLAYLIYTSGSTGRPRGVLVKHKGIVNMVTFHHQEFEIEVPCRMSQAASQSFDAMAFEVWPCLLQGAALYIVPDDIRMNPGEMKRWLIKNEVTASFQPTVMAMELLKEEWPASGVALRILWTAGERLSRYPTRPYPFRLYNLYGPTEDTIWTTWTEVPVVKESNMYPPIGTPIANHKVYILGANLKLQPIGIVGEMCIGGDGLAVGYLNQPGLTMERYVQNPFTPDQYLYRSGDLGQWMPDGNIRFIGRIDYQVKIRGFRIELGEIESRLLKHESIKEAVVIDRENQEGAKYLCAYINFHKAPGLSRAELKEYLSQELPDYMIPTYFVQLDEIPLTSSGKVDRKKLPEPEIASSEGYTAPRDSVEERLVKVWSEVLGMDALIGIDANFFELGGHSLKATILTSKIHKELDVKIPLAEVFRRSTIRGMSEYIRQAGRKKYAGIEPVEEKEYYTLSSAQKRLYFLQQMDPESTAYNMPLVLSLGKDMTKNKLESALRQLITRHESLRTSFVKVDDVPVQKIHDKVPFEMEYFEVESEVDNQEKIIENFIRPFDLSRTPLLRSGLIKIPHGNHIWIIDLHHIVSDGTSHMVLSKDFISLYNGKPLNLLRLHYKDFSGWQNRLFISGEIKAQEDYWCKLFSDGKEIPRLQLPTDYPRPAVMDFEGDSYWFGLSQEDTMRFNRLSASQGATLYMNLLAVFNVLVYKYTGQDDIIVGGVIAGRPHEDLRHIIGMFVNTLAMRNYPTGNKTFLQFLKEVKQTCLEAYENQDVQFEDLVDQLNLERDPSRNPLFDVTLVVQNFEVPVVRTKGGLNVEPYNYKKPTSLFDLSIDASEVGGEIHFRLEYWTRLFKRETILRLKDHFINIMRKVCEEPGIRIPGIDIITREEKHRLLYDFNQAGGAYAYAYLENRTLDRLFEAQVEKTPDGVAVVGIEELQISYRQLSHQANQVAAYLYVKRNIRPDDRVGVLMDHSIHLITAIMGILKAGAGYVPISPSLPGERIKTIINDAQIGVIISLEKHIRILNRMQWECDSFHTFLCLDSRDIYSVEGVIEEELKNEEKIWRYIGETASDEITGGGWLSSYTGLPLGKDEMDEYGDNALKKLNPLLNKNMRVLEIGCASGITMYRIAPRVGFYLGTDLSELIIRKNKERIQREGFENIAVMALPAHEIHKIKENNFDLVILNSVVQSFYDHSYLREVLVKVVGLMADNGYIFVGDIMNQDRKQDLIMELVDFKQKNKGKHSNYRTKTDFSDELFLSPGFFEDLQAEIPGIKNVEFSDKIFTIENELTKFRYDALLFIDKTRKDQKRITQKHKYQDDLTVLNKYNCSKANVPCLLKPNNLAYVIYTSGSVGRPKGVMVEHRNVIAYVNAFYNEFNVTSRDVMLQQASCSFDVFTEEVYPVLFRGGQIVVVEKYDLLDVERLCNIIAANDIRIISCSPLLLNELNKFNFTGRLDSVHTFISGGDVLKKEYIDNLLTVGRVYNTYGPTESTVCVTYYQCPETVEANIPIGKPIKNYKAYVVDRNNRMLPIGVAGELCVSGEGISRGYLNQPELTAEKFVLVHSSWLIADRREKKASSSEELPMSYELSAMSYLYKTGDLARWLSDGNIEFISRIDHQVKIRGYRIELGEIESQLLNWPAVKEAVLVLKQAEYLCAYVAAEEKINIPELKKGLSIHLPDYMVPSYIIQVDRIPLTQNRKVDWKRLPAPGITAREGDFIGPGNPVEEKLAEIWGEVLGIEKNSIGIQDNFFELGGHSLKVTVLVSRVHKELEVKVPLVEVFKSQTILGLSEYIRKAKQTKYAGIEPVEKKEYYALSSAQKRLYFLQQMDPGSTSYNMSLVLPLGKGIEKDKLETTLKQLIARHESLRTSFEKVNDVPVQEIHDQVEFEIEYYDLAAKNAKEREEKNLIQDFIRPFDLSRAPLIRSGLIKLPDRCIWMVDMHHIVSDGTSHTNLTEDFMAFYNGKELESLRLQYKDFSEWQNYLFKSGEIKAQENFWLELYPDAKEIPRLQLPTDYKRPEVFTFAGATFNFMLEREDAARFKDLGTRSGGTLYMNILAVLNTLFYKYTGQTDIIMGTGIAGRPHADLQPIIGMFVNTLAMRNYPSGEKTYQSFLKEVIHHSITAFENQDVQFEELVDKLDLERDASRNPVFDMMMVVQNFRRVGEGRSLSSAEDFARFEELPIADDNFPSVEYEHTTAKFDMTFFVHEIGEDILINIEYYTAIFKRDTIACLVRHFKNAIKETVSNPVVKLEDIDIVSQQEKQELLYGFNDTETAYPREKTIGELFEEQVAKAPDGAAVVFAGECLTYKVLDLQANQLANYLHQEAGVVPDQRVGILMDRSIDMIAAILGILKAGGAYVPISPSFPEERIKTMIDDAGISTLISQKRYIKTLNRVQWECEELETFLCMDSEDVHGEEEKEESELMSRKLWEYVGETAVDEITAGGWNSSYTGSPIPKAEMDEYGDNILKKLEPLLHKDMRVLEIGAASGISMYRIAPKVGLYYGTDLSAVIIEKNRERIKKEGHKNIELYTLAAHEIHQLEEKNFDLVILNSVVQCFHGHNYLGKVIRKAIDVMGNSGFIFIGDIMDQELKEDLIGDLVTFKQENRGKNYKTKIDWSEELFLSRSFLEDLAFDIPGIRDMEFSSKIYTIENELTRFRYDALLHIDKVKINREKKKRHKHQHDTRVLRKYSTGKLAAAVSSSNLSYVMYTSGSTGQPKGSLTTHYNVTRVVKNTNYIELQPGDRVLQLSDYAFDGSVFDIYGALLNGSTLVMMSREDMLEIETLCDLIERQRISVFFVTTALFNTIVDVGLKSLSGVRKVLFGGERVSVPHAAKALAYLGRERILHVYGPTETTVYATYYPINEINENQVTIPIGAPISNTWIYILDSSSRLAPIGAAGEIYIGGPGVCRGYLNDEALTKEVFVPDPFREGEIIYRTGDLGRWLSNGYVEFFGRRDHQVKVRGYRIEPGEIEGRLLTFVGIKESTVIATEDEKGSRYLCAYVVGVNDEKIEISELKDYLSQVLPDFMVPSYFVQMDKLPLGRTGKIDRSKLPDPRLSLAENFAAPRDGIEEKVIDTWSEVLGIGSELIGIDSNFFELGGHSLKATVLTSKIHKVLKVKVPLVEVFNRQTVRELCQYIRNAAGQRFFAVDKAEEREYYALSAAQKRLYIIRQMALDTTHYNMFYMFPLVGGCDKGRLENTVGKLIDRHESLRTSFHMIGDEPVQKIHKKVEFEIEYFVLAANSAKERQEKNLIQDFIRPFDLSKAPLLRVGVLKPGDTGHLLLVEMHHIISDGTSQGILEREFAALYAGENLPPLRLQYKDYSEWQNSNAQQAIMKKQEKYWLREFSGELPVLALPADYPRPLVQSFAGRQLRFFIDKDTTGFLEELCKQRDATLYMILLSVYNVLLSKLSGQEDIIIGTPTAGRRHADLQDIIGMFVNTLAMRNYPEGDKGFIEFLKEVKERTLDVYENQEYQFENLVDRVSVRRDASRNPIFDVMFNFLNQAEYQGNITGEDEDVIRDEGEVKANFDIIFQGTELEGVIYFTVDYCTKIYKEETVERFIRYFKRILSQIKENPTRKIFSLQLISGEEKQQLLVDFNETAADYSRDKTIHELFNQQVDRTPDRLAVIGHGCMDAWMHEEVHITYRELNKRSNQLAHSLKEKGVLADNIIGIMMERSMEMIIGILGILKAGGAYLPIDPEYPEERINYMLADSGAAILLTNLSSSTSGFPASSLPRFLASQTSNLVYVIYTSGTTGQPKGTLVEHRSLVNLCFWHNRYYGVTGSDRATQYASPGFDASVWEIFPYLTVGAGLYIIDEEMRLEVEKIKWYFDRHCITICFLPTQVCEQFMLTNSSTVSLKVLLTGGDKLQGYVQQSYRLVNNYGPTESTVVTTSYAVDNHQPNIPIGKPISNTRVYILDRWNHLQPVGVPGELCIAGDGLARGYLNNPEFTAEKFVLVSYRSNKSYRTYSSSKIYKTGDLARWLPDGNIEFMGRVDHQVKIRGYRIEAGEIESCLASRPEVKEAVVADRVDNTGNRYLCAYVVPHLSHLTDSPGGETFEIAELKNYLSGKIPAYMVPRYFVKIDEVPLTANGKVDRKALPEPGFERGRAHDEYEPPTNEVEEKMVEIWQEVLGIPQPGINDNFFEIGGDSIKAIQVTARMRKYGLELKVSDLFLNPTVKESAKCVAIHREVGEGEPSSTPGRLEYSRLKKEELEEYEEEFSDLD